MNDMYIDIGAESREDALKYVNYGDGINFEGDFKINGKTVVTKALDDRFGCYVLINLIKSEPEYDMYYICCSGRSGTAWCKTCGFYG